MICNRALLVLLVDLPALCCASAAIASGGATPAVSIRVPTGSGAFTWVHAQGTQARGMTVFTYMPAHVAASHAPIVFVMHGKGKNADGYRDVWARQADRHGFMVIAPLFDEQTWGGEYAGAKVFAQGALASDAAQWSFSVIEQLFNAIKTATSNRSTTYLLYGHSEGAQFVHRLVWFLPEARFSKAVAANAGWYTMPDFDTEFPYGLGKTPATPGSAKRSLERNVVVLLGDKDTDPNHSQLNKSAQAMQQGPYRLARGENFHHQAQARCEVLKCRFGWTLQRVPGAAHSNAQMAPRAAELLMQKDAGALPDRWD